MTPLCFSSAVARFNFLKTYIALLIGGDIGTIWLENGQGLTEHTAHGVTSPAPSPPAKWDGQRDERRELKNKSVKGVVIVSIVLEDDENTFLSVRI